MRVVLLRGHRLLGFQFHGKFADPDNLARPHVDRLHVSTHHSPTRIEGPSPKESPVAMRIQNVLWSVGEADRAGTTLAVALHGRGSDERGMADLADLLPPGVTLA